jgi:hypothetical protein
MKRFMKLIRNVFLAATIAVLVLAASGSVKAASSPAQTEKFSGDFFIISSLNLNKSDLFLKAPTEVTEEMLVDKNTVFLNATGQRIELKDLRAGDTVYVVARQNAKGVPVALRIQQGPMTVPILHSRYLTFK